MGLVANGVVSRVHLWVTYQGAPMDIFVNGVVTNDLWVTHQRASLGLVTHGVVTAPNGLYSKSTAPNGPRTFSWNGALVARGVFLDTLLWLALVHASFASGSPCGSMCLWMCVP